MAQTLKTALLRYCNLKSDIDELNSVAKMLTGEDKQHGNELKRQIHEYMMDHRIDCLHDTVSGLFIYRQTRSTARPLSEEMQALILDEVGKAEREGKLGSVDVQTLVLDVISLIQKVRTGKSETLKLVEKKPSSIAAVHVPQIPEVQTMMSNYIHIHQDNAKVANAVKVAKKEIVDQIKDVEPAIREYCSTRSVVKKPLSFQRNWSSAFSNTINTINPSYFAKVRKSKRRRFLCYKQSKARNRKVTSLRVSKKHIKETLESLVATKQTGWSYTSLVKKLFKQLYEEAETAIIQKLEENESAPVFKVSLGKQIEE